MNKVTRVLLAAICLIILGSGFTGCSKDRASNSEAVGIGKIEVALETVGFPSGNTYRLRNAFFQIENVRTAREEAFLFSESDPFASFLTAEVEAGEHTVTLFEGWFLERVDPNNPFFPGEVVPAELVSNAIQFVFVGANEDAFVVYEFRVGDDIVQMGPGRINIVIAVDDTGFEPPCDQDELLRRAVFETSVPAVSSFTLREVFERMAQNEGFATSADRLYGEIIDSYATADEANLADAVHCGDEVTNGVPSLNGFPITCNRIERFQFSNLDFWFPTAIVNRLDLAPANGAHCGQQRLIFANNVQGRMFFIVEAQLPNPAPEFGVAGCAPIAQFWANLQSVDDAATRGTLLREAFLFGAPELEAAGFGPFISASHHTIGSGTVRTNNFDDFPWTLREFKAVIDGDNLRMIPFPVGESPNGELWNDSSPLPQGEECRDAFLDAAENLVTNNPAAMSFVVPQQCRNSESRNDFFSEDYVLHLSEGDPNGFRAALEERFGLDGLTPEDIASRARFAGSCIGCHEEATGSFLGQDVFAPFSNGFVHVDEFSQETCGTDSCFRISPGLADTFLPHRFSVVESLLGVDLPENACNGGGGGEDGGIVFPPGLDGGILIDPQIGDPAPIFEPELPSADVPVDELVQMDYEARAVFGATTLGGQSAQRTH